MGRMDLLRAPVSLSLMDSKRHLIFSFTCPEGVSELLIDWRFSPLLAGELKTLVTLSLVGPGGFRGAGHRHGDHQQVRVGPYEATPGYLPGPLPAGEWTVTLHTHLVVDVTEGELSVVALEQSSQAAEQGHPVPVPRLQNQAAPSGWMLGDLHCHTTHSDGRWTPEELAAAAAMRGLGFLSLTDHNTLSGRDDLGRSFPGLTLPGLELTTYYGHATVVGVPEYLDWTRLEPGRGMRELAEEMTRRGAQLTIAHPFAVGDPICTGCAWTTFDLRPENTTHLEVWNGPWNGGQRYNERALACWYEMLESGRRVVATAGTDAHGPAYLPGVAFTCTPATSDPATLLTQLRTGMTYLTTSAPDASAGLAPGFHSPAGPISLGAEGPAGVWEVSWHAGGFPAGSAVTAVVDGQRFTGQSAGEGETSRRFEVRRWLNLEVRGPDGTLLALTNPVYAAASGPA